MGHHAAVNDRSLAVRVDYTQGRDILVLDLLILLPHGTLIALPEHGILVQGGFAVGAGLNTPVDLFLISEDVRVAALASGEPGIRSFDLDFFDLHDKLLLLRLALGRRAGHRLTVAGFLGACLGADLGGCLTGNVG